MSKMIAELTDSLEHLNKKAQRAQEKAQAALAAAEDAHAAAEEAQYLLRAAAIMEEKECRTALHLEVEMTCHEPDLTWTGQSVEVNVEIDVSGQELVLENHHVALERCDLDALTPDYAVVRFSILDLVEVISEVLEDDASCDEERAQSIQAITNELQKRLL